MEIDAIVFETPSVRIGAFRCPVGHPSFRDSGPIRDHCFVFPRTPVVIQHSGSQPFAADPTLVALYNRGQEYWRLPVSPDGDRCDWYAVSDALLRDALADYDAPASDDSRRPIRFAFARTEPATYLSQRELFSRVERDSATDPFSVEETVLELLDKVLAAAYSKRRPRGSAEAKPPAAESLAYDAATLLGRRFADALTLADIAAALGTSPFHLCRSFKRATGCTLHGYRNQLRLRSALDQLEERDADLSQLALAYSYSSHSHFTASFRRAFGVTPSVARARLGSRKS